MYERVCVPPRESWKSAADRHTHRQTKPDHTHTHTHMTLCKSQNSAAKIAAISLAQPLKIAPDTQAKQPQ